MLIPHSKARTRTSRRAGAVPVPAFFLYGEPLQPPDERLVHVETIASRSRQHNWDIRPHRHRDLHQVLLTQRGQVEARVDEIAESLRAPAIVVTPPGAVHSFRFQPGTIGLVASFAPGVVPGLESGGSNIAHFLERPAVLALDRASVNVTDLEVLGGMLLREFGRSAPGRHVALRGLVAAMLANVMRLTRSTETGGPDFAAPECELVARFRRIVELRYREHAGLAAYAAELGISQAQLRRACLSVTGQSPVELVHLRLLVEAERQLRYTSLSIAQIGYHLGFQDPAYFSRFFTTRMRLSPREFRSGRALGGC
jgi:AraC family transcriptional activator of pobA